MPRSSVRTSPLAREFKPKPKLISDRLYRLQLSKVAQAIFYMTKPLSAKNKVSRFKGKRIRSRLASIWCEKNRPHLPALPVELDKMPAVKSGMKGPEPVAPKIKANFRADRKMPDLFSSYGTTSSFTLRPPGS